MNRLKVNLQGLAVVRHVHGALEIDVHRFAIVVFDVPKRAQTVVVPGGLLAYGLLEQQAHGGDRCGDDCHGGLGDAQDAKDDLSEGLV